MPKGSIPQNNFTAGEISPRMYGRTDIVRYQNAAKVIENCIVQIQGGCIRRPGLEYVTPAKFDDKRGRLVPYVFNVSQAYHLEFSHNVIRVFNANGQRVDVSPGVPVEIASPYVEAHLHNIDFCQRADTMFIFHEAVPTHRLQRLSDTNWRLMPVPWVTEPFDELGYLSLAGLTLSSTAVGAGRTFTCSAPEFLPSDVGRTIESGGGLATITGYTSATVVTCTIVYPFQSTGIAGTGWLLTGSPQSTVTPSAAGPVGTAITLNASIGTWRTVDVGKHVVINGGLVQLGAVTSSTVATGTIRVEMAAAVAAEPSAWALCRSMWGAEFGYPRTGAFYQQRLWAAGSPGFPQSAWMSRLGEYYDFEIGDTADAAFETRIDSDQANPIRHIASSRALAVLTLGQEFTIAAAGDGGVKPGNIDANPQSVFGCNEVAPVRVGSELLFVSQSGRKVRAYSPDRFDSSTFAAPDLTALAEHITESGITDMDAFSEPDALVLCVLGDGQMAALTLDRDNDVVAWTRFITDGVFESVSVAPWNGIQLAMALVRRTIDGVTRRSIEVFRTHLMTDSAVLAQSPTPFDTVGGLTHLEGKTVTIKADDVYMGEQVVDGGSITINRTATKIEVGLPYTPRIRLLPPDMQGPWGTSLGKITRTTEFFILVKDTAGAQVNGREVIFQRFGPDALDQPFPMVSGWERVEQLGYDRAEVVEEITQPRPLPFHLLAVVRDIEVNP